MKTKICISCKKRKLLLKFRQHKDTKYYHSYCKLCEKTIKDYPWIKTYRAIMVRCYYDKNSTYYLKIQNYLTLKDLRYLWFRDKAYLMKKPSIDRINSKKHYRLNNCRYIESTKNTRNRG